MLPVVLHRQILKKQFYLLEISQRREKKRNILLSYLTGSCSGRDGLTKSKLSGLTEAKGKFPLTTTFR